MAILDQEQIDRFQTNGFVLGPTILSQAEIDELRGEIERVIANDKNPNSDQPVLLHNFGKPEAPVWQIVNIWQASSAFERLMKRPEIVEAVATLMSADALRIWHDQIQYKPAAVGGVNMWHQDSPSWPPVRPMTQVSAWVALDDVDVDNGCMSMVVGSQKWGVQADFLNTIKKFDEMPAMFDGHPTEIKTCPVPAGGVHFHHGLTWHGSSANTSGRPRRAIALHYMVANSTLVEGEHVMMPYIMAKVGEVIEGDSFPVVWSKDATTVESHRTPSLAAR